MINFTSHYSGSKGNLYQLTDGKISLLIDPGIPVAKIKKALNFKLSNISGALVSHLHHDHSLGATELAKSGIDIYAGNETIKSLGLNGHRVHLIEHLKQFNIETFRILPFLIPHDVENFGFLIQSGNDKFLYLIDCAYCPYKFDGLTSIAIGVNYQTNILEDNIKKGHLHPALGRRIMQSHMSLKTGLQFFREQDISKIQSIHILHCSSTNSDKDQIKTAVMRQTGKLVIMPGE